MQLHRIASALLLASAVPMAALTAPGSSMAAASASVLAADKQGAVVVKGFPCTITPPSGSPATSTRGHTVISPSGNVTFVCHADSETRLPQTIVLQDTPCVTPGGITLDSHLVASRSGQVSLICHVHPHAHAARQRAEHRWRNGEVAEIRRDRAR